ncbi:hypothetical protein J6590_007088 [Homalodisca vitripennis]|nr:hypothetical protein J6590_007088 [Homalodisca vitripennis]
MIIDAVVGDSAQSKPPCNHFIRSPPLMSPELRISVLGNIDVKNRPYNSPGRRLFSDPISPFLPRGQIVFVPFWSLPAWLLRTLRQLDAACPKCRELPRLSFYLYGVGGGGCVGLGALLPLARYSLQFGPRLQRLCLDSQRPRGDTNAGITAERSGQQRIKAARNMKTSD